MLQRSVTGVAYLPDGHIELPKPRPSRPLGRAFLIFLTVFLVLQWLWESARGSSVEQLVVHQATVVPATALIGILTPEIPVQAIGSSIKAPGGGLNILNGCEGTETAFLMIAAIVAAGLSWHATLAAFAVGLLCIFLLNQARILTLFYAFRLSREWFDLLHTAVLPAILVALTLVCFRAILQIAYRRSS